MEIKALCSLNSFLLPIKEISKEADVEAHVSILHLFRKKKKKKDQKNRNTGI